MTLDLHAEIERLRMELARAAASRTLRTADEWSEEDGPVLWWALAMGMIEGKPHLFFSGEPPWVGTPLDEDYPEHVTHWTRLQLPIGVGP